MMSTTDMFDLKTAPMRIGTVRLKVRNLPAVSSFYRRVLGLILLAEGESSVTLGTDTTPLLHIEGDPDLVPRDPHQAGLFHTAFVMPTRADLARWLAFIIEARVPLQGASDHNVSEAIYLADPEGNGLEVYADRAPSRWRGANGRIRMTTEALDLQGLLAAADDTAWSGFPEGGHIGHVHLQVGDTTEAERFYSAILGFDITMRYPGASFFGSGGYHHQLAGNVWNSRSAGPPPKDRAGLAEVTLRADPAQRDAIVARAGSHRLTDPWGMPFVITS